MSGRQPGGPWQQDQAALPQQCHACDQVHTGVALLRLLTSDLMLPPPPSSSLQVSIESLGLPLLAAAAPSGRLPRMLWPKLPRLLPQASCSIPPPGLLGEGLWGPVSRGPTP